MAAEMIVMLPEVAARVLERNSRKLADVTGLLDEWVCFLSPKRATREAALAGCADFEGWRGIASASVSAQVVRHAREASEDEAFVAAVAASPSLGHWVEDGAFVEKALPVVLGFGVLAAIRLGIGVEGATLRQKRRKAHAQEAEAERRSGSDASEQRPSLAPLGRSVPWADDGGET
jgi:hypothetical protein